jgi:hypothetical protein
MIFNKNWTKEDNRLHIKLMNEKKSKDEIISIMGLEKLQHHPNGKYLHGYMYYFLKHFNSIKKYDKNYKSLYSEYHNISSLINDGGVNDLVFEFELNSKIKYNLELIYYKDTNNKKYYILKDKDNLMYKNKDELEEIKERLIYIFNKFFVHKNEKEITYILNITDDLKKMNFYKELIIFMINSLNIKYEEYQDKFILDDNLNSYYFKLALK